jgi:hypothetical protein
MMQYAGVLEKVQSKEIFMGLSTLMGLEVPPELEEALDAHFAEKERKEKEMQAQMQQSGYTVGPDGKPLPAQAQPKDGKEEPKGKEDDKEKKPMPPMRKVWIPTAPEAEEMRVWYEVAQRKLKRAESLDFEYTPHHGGVPVEVADSIRARLLTATTADDVRQAFVLEETVTPAPEYKSDVTPSDILVLAAAINKLADKEKG